MNTMTHALQIQSEWIDAAKFEVLYSLSRRTYWQWITEGKLTAEDGKPCYNANVSRSRLPSSPKPDGVKSVDKND